MTTHTRVSAVVDIHRVLLAVSGMPLVDKSHSPVTVVPEEITLIYQREDDATDYTLFRIEVDGARARRDGTPGGARAAASFHPGSYGDGPPEWLLGLAATHRPAGPPVAAQFPPDPDVIDLDVTP